MLLAAKEEGGGKKSKVNTDRREHKERETGTPAHTRQPCRIERGGPRGVNINTDSVVVAQQVIMITTCSLCGFSLISFLSTYPS